MSVFFRKRGKAAAENKYYWQKYAITSEYGTVETAENGTVSFANSVASIYKTRDLAAIASGGSFQFDSDTFLSNYINYDIWKTDPYFSTSRNSTVAYYCYSSPYQSGGSYLVPYSKKYTRVLNETKGAYISDVASTDSDAYPENGIKDGYWYVKI